MEYVRNEQFVSLELEELILTIPIMLLSGFLGSGKTTLLKRMLEHYRKEGLKPAVVMNEIGEVNLDGQLVEEGVPMSELLSGCICCSISGDLGMELLQLIRNESPDLIIIECTGIANPMEVLEAASEASLLARAAIMDLITLVDGKQLLHAGQSGSRKTYKLMQEQIRCATRIIVNKLDAMSAEETVEAERILREWNAHAELVHTRYAEVELDNWLSHKKSRIQLIERTERSSVHRSSSLLHPTHSHVMVYTHYFHAPVHSERFELLMQELPERVYRAKGILTFSDTTDRFLFQYAYRQLDFMRIRPQDEVPDVAVFIGEYFNRKELEKRILSLIEDSR